MREREMWGEKDGERKKREGRIDQIARYERSSLKKAFICKKEQYRLEQCLKLRDRKRRKNNK